MFGAEIYVDSYHESLHSVVLWIASAWLYEVHV